jgi:hypothetical protein
MFCPICRAEYRRGFTRCSDCAVELVSFLPPDLESDPNSARNEKPDQARPTHFLAWFLPMAGFYLVILLLMLKPSIMTKPFIILVVMVMIMSCDFGALWMLYQSVRYEERVGRYALLSFIPFMFIWYRLVRYPIRPELVRKAGPAG